MSFSRRAVAAIVPLALAACAGGNSAALPGSTPQPPPARSPIPAPAGLVAPGHLTMGADYHFAPQSYVDADGKAAGFDVDLAGAIASQLHLKLSVINIDDPGIIQGLSDQPRRYDIGANQPSSVASVAPGAVTLAYFESGQAILVGTGNRKVKGVDTLCGLKVGAAPGSEGELALVTVNDKACHDNKVKIQAAPDDVVAARDVGAGRLDALVDDYPAAVLLSRTTSGTRVVPHHAPVTEVDYVFPPGGEAIRDAVAKALDRLKKDGTYKRLLDKWGLGEGAVK